MTILIRNATLALTALAFAAGPALAQEGPSFSVGGTTYTKFLWGNQQDQGALYNFTTVPGEGYGDNGQGTEIELLLSGRLSRQVEVKGRLHSRFSQNFWTSFDGFGGAYDPAKGPDQCVAASCGEYDPRSNWYIKLRGMAVTLTPGYLIDSATIGANDWGQFDPFVVGRIRYIDRDNMYGILVQGSLLSRKLTWDIGRISLPKLWAGPMYGTGIFHAQDASYVAQAKYVLSEQLDFAGLFNYVSDVELNATDRNVDDGRDLSWRFRNGVGGLKAAWHPTAQFDMRGSAYYSYMNTVPGLAPAEFTAATSGFSPTPLGRHMDGSYKLDVAVNDPLAMGLSLNVQLFSIGADYVSVLAARRESDVLLTEGHDGAFMFPGPSNANFGVFGGNATRIGYGGWSGGKDLRGNHADQVATVNVDNEFTDFDETPAETVIGWKGATFNPVYSSSSVELSGEYSYITYNTNWQAWGNDGRPVAASLYPSMEVDTGVGHNFRSAYAPFQDKQTHLLAVNGKYTLDVLKGIDLFGKVKFLYESDKRLNDRRYLPFQPGDCPGNGQPCLGNRNLYNGVNSTADIYGNPDVVNADGAVGYKFKPFDDISDDDRLLRYFTFGVGAGYQLTDDLYLALHYQKYLADLKDGNTALQAYSLHEMASGWHDKNQFVLRAKYVLSGVEFGLEGQWSFGVFKPDFGDGFVEQRATEEISKNNNVAVGSRGFVGRQGGWNSLEDRHFSQLRVKAFMKAQF
jgi:hypothetical protein